MNEESGSPLSTPTPAPTPAPSGGSDDKIWMVLCHLSLFLGVALVLPLVVYLVKKDDAPATAEHAKEALNFHISLLIYGIVSGILCSVFIGILLIPIVAIFGFVCAIIACVKASKGEFYRYPLTLRLVK